MAPPAIDAIALLDGFGRVRDLGHGQGINGQKSLGPSVHVFTVDGTAIKLQSSTKKSTLTPTWKETFEVALPKGRPTPSGNLPSLWRTGTASPPPISWVE